MTTIKSRHDGNMHPRPMPHIAQRHAATGIIRIMSVNGGHANVLAVNRLIRIICVSIRRQTTDCDTGLCNIDAELTATLVPSLARQIETSRTTMLLKPIPSYSGLPEYNRLCVALEDWKS